MNRIRLFVYVLCALLIITIKKLSVPTTISSSEAPVNLKAASENEDGRQCFDSQHITYSNPDGSSFSHSIDSCCDTKAVVGEVTLDSFFKTREHY